MTQKISKKFIIVMSVIVAVVLLSAWVVVSGFADYIHYSFIVMNTHVEPEGGVHILESLKPGKYLLQRDWGLDETEYIEITDYQTVRFVGEYWENFDAKYRAMAEEEDRFYGPYYSEWNCYSMGELLQHVSVAGTPSGFGYVDENTLSMTRERDEINDVTDYNHEANKPSVPRYDERHVIAHYIYVEGA
ncbi:MAG: hypothetical protein NC084_08045 [Bacteroides sp.]|nr:hypothetical protein [Eubacterium sp.]MCM1418592.1 hypothetical protein [Roseburia sp.]MCM1462646.1 hypothetical protein [Bacteroides sp.]